MEADGMRDRVVDEDHEKTPNPPANIVNERTVIVATVNRRPRACRSFSDTAALQVTQT
jgi:hypothetical protein